LCFQKDNDAFFYGNAKPGIAAKIAVSRIQKHELTMVINPNIIFFHLNGDT